jgi:hypothetical protein
MLTVDKEEEMEVMDKESKEIKIEESKREVKGKGQEKNNVEVKDKKRRGKARRKEFCCYAHFISVFV